MIDVILGLQWGDEGKGKIVDYLSSEYDLVARFQGGPNAGHTVYREGKPIALHHIPSGIMRDRPMCLIGDGCVVDPITLAEEIENLEALGIQTRGKLFIGKRAHIILPTHRMLDGAEEETRGKKRIDTTKRGIGPAYADKTARNGIRVIDLQNAKDPMDMVTRLADSHNKQLAILNGTGKSFNYDWTEKMKESVKILLSFPIVETPDLIHLELSQNHKILAEGAQGTLLDLDYGSYPYVTSSRTTIAGVLGGLGVSHKKIGKVMGVAKAYCTRVGEGPFPTELLDGLGETMRAKGNEFGSTTGRPRRCGWLDLVLLAHAIRMNGVDELIFTKVDILGDFKKIAFCTAYNVGGDKARVIPENLSDVTPVYHWEKGWSGTNSQNGEIHKTKLDIQLVENLLENMLAKAEIHIPIKCMSTGPERKDIVLV